jgi:Tfp pilus assembly protein PilN
MKAVNLIPGEQRAGAGGIRGHSGGGALIVLGLLAGLVVLAVMYGKAHHQVSAESGQIATLAAQTSAIQARTGRLTPYASFVSMADKRVQTVAQLVQSRFDWSHSLHELGRVLPRGAAISSLQGTVGASSSTTASTSATTSTSATASAGATPASSTPPGSTPVFTLTGCATSQSEVAQTLQRLRLMNGAGEVQLQSSTKSASGGANTSTGSCPSGDPTFSAQVTFAALPTAPATSLSTATPASSHGGARTHPVSVKGTGVPR